MPFIAVRNSKHILEMRNMSGCFLTKSSQMQCDKLSILLHYNKIYFKCLSSVHNVKIKIDYCNKQTTQGRANKRKILVLSMSRK